MEVIQACMHDDETIDLIVRPGEVMYGTYARLFYLIFYDYFRDWMTFPQEAVAGAEPIVERVKVKTEKGQKEAKEFDSVEAEGLEETIGVQIIFTRFCKDETIRDLFGNKRPREDSRDDDVKEPETKKAKMEAGPVVKKESS